MNAAVTATVRWLRLDVDRWTRVGPQSLWSAMAIVVVTAGLLALVRFGGLVGEAPRAYLRLTLVTVWGWIALSFALVLLTRLAQPAAGWNVRTIPAVVGLSHVPLATLAGVTLIAGGMLEILGPGRVLAVFALAAWVPASVIVGISVTAETALRRAAAIAAVPYGLWLVLFARHVLGQVDHLL